MRSQEKFLLVLALIGEVGGTLIVSEWAQAGRTAVSADAGPTVVAKGEISRDPKEQTAYPRGPLPRTRPSGWITEYPSAALLSDMEGRLTVRLTVDPYGEVSGCEVIESSGVKAFDLRSCAALASNARFYPALDENQSPVTAQFIQSVRYAIPGKETGGDSFLTIKVHVTKSGEITQCHAFVNDRADFDPMVFCRDGKRRWLEREIASSPAPKGYEGWQSLGFGREAADWLLQAE